MKNITRTELVWVGKYDEQGNPRPVERTILPFQVVETVNESKADREKAQRDLFTLMPRDDTWRNMLIWGDNKVVMASLLPRFAGKINLIYIDPPFATGQDFSYKVRIGDEEFVKEPSIIEEKAYRDTWGRGLDSYLQMMYDRLVLMRDLLAEDGSIWVHLDWHVGHYIKVLMDEIFSYDNFVADIVWRREVARGRKAQAEFFGHNADYILVYTKSRNQGKYKPITKYVTYTKEEAEKLFYKDELGYFSTSHRGTYSDDAIIELAKQNRIFVTRGGTLIIHGGKVSTTKGTIRIKYYLDKIDDNLYAKQVYIDNIWDDIRGLAEASPEERAGFDTQKPAALLERILTTSTDEGDLVADFFCVRKGTRVWKVEVPPHAGEQTFSLPACGQGWGVGSLIPIECIQPGDWVLAHDGRPHRVLRTFRRLYRGWMIGIQHSESPATLWLTADHRVLAKLRPRSLGGCDWLAAPTAHMERRKQPQEVEDCLQGVVEANEQAREEQNSLDGAEWIMASELCVGDTVFVGMERVGVQIERVQRVFSEEEVYDLEVEEAHSYITEVCVVHNCGSGTTLAVAEKLGRRWIGCDLSKWAIQVTRKRLLQISGCKPFEILNLGNYERHKLAANGQWGRYVQFILQLYRAEPITGFQTLHGKKARAYVHVGSVDSPITMREIRQTLKEAQSVGAREVHFLGWDFEMGLHDLVIQVGDDYGVKVRLVSIPREALEVTDPAKEEVRFFDLSYLELEHKIEGKKLTIRLKDFIIANPEYIPEEVREKITKFTDYIDYWAVDWDYKDDTFHNGWQSFRTRKQPTLETEAIHTYEQPGTYKVLVKVVDIFGNDTTKIVEVNI